MGELAQRFTIADYEAILHAASENGYRFGRFTDPEPQDGSRVVYLRHDIDNSVPSAVVMAESEARAGAISTYLALVRSENYNPFSAANVRGLRRLRELGHDVGLHFSSEEHDPNELRQDLGACIRRDARLLEDALGDPIRVFSFHNPAEKAEFTVDVPGLVNAYADRFFAGAGYLSESNMRWRRPPIDVLASGEHPVIQILVHPLSYRADFSSDRDVLMWFIADNVRRLLELNVGQNRVLREQNITPVDVAVHLTQEVMP